MPSKTFMQVFLLSASALFAASSPVYAEPEKPSSTAELMDKIDDKLSDHKVNLAKSAARLKRNLDKQDIDPDADMSETLEQAADLMEEVFAEDGLFRDLAAMFSDLASEVNVDKDDGRTVLSFDGTTIAEMETRKSRNSEDGFSIFALGRQLTMDRETIVEDGKSKTRIVIEMDGEDGIDLTLPELD